jgi:hypothetical protein
MPASGRFVMTTIRFILLAAGLFALAFIGLSWSQKGFPVMALKIEPPKPDARIPTFEESVQKGARKDWENSKTNQSDGDKERDQLRLALAQASTGYKLSPCDPTMKKNLVAAVTGYIEAWRIKFNCRPGVDGCPKNEDARIETAAAAFKTAADLRVHAALREAYEQGGVGPEDFPGSVRNYIYLFSGRPFPGEEAACVASRRADNRR